MRSAAPPVRAIAGQFAADVARDLQRRPKQLQSQYLYDALGSALFEAICRLPWYCITRAEARLLARHAREIIEPALGGSGRRASIAELGVGSGEKLATILEALPDGCGADVHLLDISPAALDAATARLAALPRVSVTRREGTYQQGLDHLARTPAAGGRRLVLFLGSNIGNFDRAAAGDLLLDVRRAMREGDLLLLGADLVKPAGDLLLAYDDPLGVTAAFNLNLLVRINRELGGDFDLSAFFHRAVWNEVASRVEMHLVSRAPQAVRIPGAGLQVSFEAGESIWTESSYKYREEDLVELGRTAGFEAARQWMDASARFALTLFVTS